MVGYREAVDRVVPAASTNPADWRRHFFEILICASQLYLGYLLVVRDLTALETVSSKSGSSGHVRVDTVREKNLREKLKQELESSPCWGYFKPDNPLSEFTGLRNLQDYLDRFTLHLPEIYEETFRLESCTKEFLASHDRAALAQFTVGLQHLGRNHISFVLQALEWAADEDSWEESLAAPTAS